MTKETFDSNCRGYGHNFVASEMGTNQRVLSLYCTKCGEQKTLEYPDKGPAKLEAA
jgi:hypothetical protein